jgi:hypothetical protein
MTKDGGIMRSKKVMASWLALVGALAAVLLAAAPTTAPAAEKAKPFSFAVYGDSRTMMYLPSRLEQREEAIKLMVEMFNLVMPEKYAEEVVRKDVKLSYDPATGELVQVVMPFMSRSEVMTLTVDKGWVTEASVEDVKLLPGVRRTIFRFQGGDWVAQGIVKAIQGGRADFVVSSGDLVWWGNQGRTVFDSPYWKHVDRTMMSQLPAPSASMRAAGLEGRWYSSVGNHEVWGDPRVEGVLSAVPYLKKLGVSADQLVYKFDYLGARFIYLWTGKYDYRAPTAWDATRPSFEDQMKQLKQWLDEAKAKGTRKVFVTFHNPAFARSGMGAIPEAQNPHKFLAPYAKDLEIVVFNGHVHTTELFEVDGVKYLMLGGGGAEQDPILPGRTSVKVPEGYPPDLYWKGEAPKEEYNYLLVDVQPGKKTRFTLHRFRPWSAEPFATVELFK